MTPWVKRLLFINIGMFFLQQTVPIVTNMLLLYPPRLLVAPWTLVTYMFLHDPSGIWHLAFNMFGLFFFGPRLESRFGSRHFILLYLVSGLAGALASIITAYNTPILGASAAVYGLFLAFARNWPHERIMIWGIIPVEARVLVIIMTVMSIWGGLGVWGGSIAHFAHLGGFVGGWLYLKWFERNAPTRKFKEKALVGTMKGRSDSADLKRWSTIPRDKLHPLNREEVERLFRKIETSGVKSLTLEERASLDRFSAPVS